MTDQFFPEHDDMPPEAGLASPRCDVPEPPHPGNWNLLTANDLEAELLELNRWVDWLRHTYAHKALKSSEGDLSVVQGLLGHKNINTTAIYVKADMSERIRVAEKLKSSV